MAYVHTSGKLHCRWVCCVQFGCNWNMIHGIFFVSSHRSLIDALNDSASQWVVEELPLHGDKWIGKSSLLCCDCFSNPCWVNGRMLPWTCMNSCTWFIMACMYGVTLSDWYKSTKSLPHCLYLLSNSSIALAYNSLAGFEKIMFRDTSSHRCWILPHSSGLTSGNNALMSMFWHTFNFSVKAKYLLDSWVAIVGAFVEVLRAERRMHGWFHPGDFHFRLSSFLSPIVDFSGLSLRSLSLLSTR